MPKSRIVILGGGFGGLNAAKQFRTAPEAEVTVIDRTNHHLFQPLLYQVATAVLAPSDIATPIRHLLRKQRFTTTLLAEAREIDPTRRVVVVDDDRKEIPYDYLIIATGTRHSYFGHPEWEVDAPGLKSLEDAREIRRRFLLAYELAEKSTDPAEIEALLTFVIVGGGPTGVELAGILPEVARNALPRDFRHIDTRRTRVLLLEGGERVLPTYPAELSERARRDLVELGAEVRTGAKVTRIDSDAVFVGDERIATRTVFWAAGNAASPIARTLGVPLDRAGRVIVESDLSVPGHPEIFVIGDLAVMTSDGKPVPGVAQGAIQSGRAAARNVLRSIRGQPRKPFHYWNKGDMATIGRRKAIADFGTLPVIGPLRIGGRIAWFLWLFIHIMYLVGFRNRLSVLLEWAYAYFTYQRGVRIIAGDEMHELQPGNPGPRVDTVAAGSPTSGHG
jgi:NADH dehydrogenase